MPTTITPSTLTVADLVAKYVPPPESKEECEARIASIRTAVLGDIAALFALEPRLRTIKIVAYTPGFNDGEPCTHTQNEAVINGWDEYSCEEEDDDMPDVLMDEPDHVRATDPEGAPPTGKDYPTTPTWQRDGVGKQIRQVLDSMAPQLEDAYETNWCLWVWRASDGSIKHDLCEYECGY